MRQPSFQGIPSVSVDTLELNAAYSQGLNFPPPKASSKKLAIVGGGKSVWSRIGELSHWDGEIWGINGAASWLIGRGINATLFTISPCKYPPEYLLDVKRAIIAHHCDPWLFDSLKAAEIFAFDNCGNGPTSACAAIPLTLGMGYDEVRIFGCEASYLGSTHAYQNTPDPSEMQVRVNGSDFITNIGYFMQSQLLAHLIREAPNYCKDRSGGLLGALIADPQGWDVIRLPSEMKEAA